MEIVSNGPTPEVMTGDHGDHQTPIDPMVLPAAAREDYREYLRAGGRFDLTTWWMRYKDDYVA